MDVRKYYEGFGQMVPNKAQFDDRIRNLMALAEDNSTESRTLLFSHICDLFLQERPMESDNQVRMLIEIINELISDVDLTIRIELRNILLNIDSPPTPLVKLISEDIVEVSGPLLEEAQIDDEQLLYLIKYASNDHRDHIGRRFGLTPLIRRELEKARREAQAEEKIAHFEDLAENKKISLAELEEAEQNSNVLTEDSTASILEALRATKNKSKSDFAVVESSQPSENMEEENSEDANIERKPISLTSRITHGKIEEQIINEDETIETSDIYNNDPNERSNEFSSDYDQSIEEDSVEYVKEAVSQLIDKEYDSEEELSDKDVNAVTDEWFWEIDRYGNITYLSDNSEAIFLLPPSDMYGEDFLCLWEKQDTDEGDHNDFIALFEKRLPFRDQTFSIDISPNIVQHYLLSAVATFDPDTGRFTGFRGSAQIDQNSFNTESLRDEIEDVKKDNIDNEDHKPKFSIGLVENTNQNDDVHANNDASPDLSNEEIIENQDEVASELLHNLSHEFRTPLNAIIGFSQMIDNEMWGPVSDNYKKNTKDIINAANHLKEAVNNILDSAKLEAGLIEPTPESFSLKSVIQEAMKAISPILESKEIKVSGIEDNIDVILYNDKYCVILCLIKMITYAVRNAEIGDNLHISVMVNSNAEVRIEIPLLNQYIKEEDSHKLFQKVNNLSSTKSENPEFEAKISSGFGLSVAQDIAKIVGSEITTMNKNQYISHIVLTISTYPL